MRVPIRKPGTYTHMKPDPHLTQAKVIEFKKKLERLKTVDQPRAASEVSRLAEMGDFSENAAYQMAKGRLRGINQRIGQLEDHLQRAIIITPSNNTDVVQQGHTVTINMHGKEVSYQLLGSSETDPQNGIISGNSPIGAALLGKKVGDQIQIRLGDTDVSCTVLRIA